MSDDSLLLFPRSPSPARTEWIGKQYRLPEKVRDGDAAYHPEVVMWLELPSGFLLTATPYDPRKPVPFAHILGELIDDLPEGSSRPSRIRVPEKRLAEQVRQQVGKIPVLVGPVPELDKVFAQLARDTAAGPSYLGDGEIPPALMGKLFAVAAAFFRAAPWRYLSEDQLVRTDIPQLGIEGACLSVIGGAGESFGLLLFPSIDAFDEFAEMPPEMFDDDELDFEDGRTFLLSLSFGRRKELPPRMLREIEEYGWPVAGAKAYPTVMAMNENRRPKPVSARDVTLMTACASAFISFFEHHRDRFRKAPPEPVTEMFGEEGMSVTLTAPFPGGEDRFGAGQETSEERMTVHEMDHHLVLEIGEFALARFGRGWIGRAGKDFIADDISQPLFPPWLTWTAVSGGKRVADAFLEEKGSRLGRDEREWIAAQRSAWLSVWEVTALERGKGWRSAIC